MNTPTEAAEQLPMFLRNESDNASAAAVARVLLYDTAAASDELARLIAHADD